jgi:hypothetical protein
VGVQFHVSNVSPEQVSLFRRTERERVNKLLDEYVHQCWKMKVLSIFPIFLHFSCSFMHLASDFCAVVIIKMTFWLVAATLVVVLFFFANTQRIARQYIKRIEFLLHDALSQTGLCQGRKKTKIKNKEEKEKKTRYDGNSTPNSGREQK